MRISKALRQYSTELVACACNKYALPHLKSVGTVCFIHPMTPYWLSYDDVTRDQRVPLAAIVKPEAI